MGTVPIGSENKVQINSNTARNLGVREEGRIVGVDSLGNYVIEVQTMRGQTISISIKPDAFYVMKTSPTFQQEAQTASSFQASQGAAGLYMGTELRPQWVIDYEQNKTPTPGQQAIFTNKPSESPFIRNTTPEESALILGGKTGLAGGYSQNMFGEVVQIIPPKTTYTESEFSTQGGRDLIFQPGRAELGGNLYQKFDFEGITAYQQISPRNEVELGSLVSQFAVMEFAGIAVSKAPAAYKFFGELGNTKIGFGIEKGVFAFGSKPGGYAIAYTKPTFSFSMPKTEGALPKFEITYLRSLTSKEEMQGIGGRNIFLAGDNEAPMFSPVSFISKEGTAVMGRNEIKNLALSSFERETAISFPKNEFAVKTINKAWNVDTFTTISNKPVKMDKFITFDTFTQESSMKAIRADIAGLKISQSTKYLPRNPKGMSGRNMFEPVNTGDITPTPFSKSFGDLGNLGRGGTQTIQIPGWMESYNKNPLLEYAPAIGKIKIISKLPSKTKISNPFLYNAVFPGSIGKFPGLEGSGWAKLESAQFSIINTGNKSKTNIGLKSNAGLKFNSLNKFKTTSFEISSLGTSSQFMQTQKPNVYEITLTKQSQIYRQTQKQAILQLTLPKQSQYIQTGKGFIKPIPQRFKFPLMPFFGQGGKSSNFDLASFISPKRSYSYAPSLSSIFLGTKSFKAPKTLTGLEVRPLIVSGKRRRKHPTIARKKRRRRK